MFLNSTVPVLSCSPIESVAFFAPSGIDELKETRFHAKVPVSHFAEFHTLSFFSPC